MMEIKAVDLELFTVLNRIITNLEDPENQYMVSANYYDHQTPDRFGERWYIAQIWISQESASNVILTDEGLVCDVHLNRHDLSQTSKILLPYDQIWNIQQLTGSVEYHPRLYYRGDKLNLKRPSDDE
ncbi:hypothetical protein [Larkinella humicola]|uniref:Uncharacterized protein n=1 Tax=Larkinella humicola TaxID=2607654 RepID=A0A5N1J7L1_9BACT|nr:hypothetical protein [Larkinella humicola]KAA9341167.1 hypothetical protein F0P93_30495 [Larkinella humicola]